MIALSVAAFLFSIIALAAAFGQFVLTARVQMAANKIVEAWDDKTEEIDLDGQVDQAETEAQVVEQHWYKKDLN